VGVVDELSRSPTLSATSDRRALVDQVQVPVDRRARPHDVAGREEVEQAPPQHRQQEGPVDVVGLRAHLVEKAEPVADGRRVGCVFCVRADEETAQLRVMLVHPDARKRGLGTMLTAECVRFARAVGYRRLRLWTTNLQVAARAVYLSAGFAPTGEEPYAGFGPAVTGQTYELAL